MNQIDLVKCLITGSDNNFKTKFCLLYNGIYYDMLTLDKVNHYADGDDYEYFIALAQFLDENKLGSDAKRSLNRRKQELLNRLQATDNMVVSNEFDIFKRCDCVNFVIYYCNRAELRDGFYYLSEQDEAKVGIMINNTVYDLLTSKKVKTLNEGEFNLNDEYLSTVKMIPSEYFDEIDEAFFTIATINLILQTTDRSKSKILRLGPVGKCSNPFLN